MHTRSGLFPRINTCFELCQSIREILRGFARIARASTNTVTMDASTNRVTRDARFKCGTMQACITRANNSAACLCEQQQQIVKFVACKQLSFHITYVFVSYFITLNIVTNKTIKIILCNCSVFLRHLRQQLLGSKTNMIFQS